MCAGKLFYVKPQYNILAGLMAKMKSQVLQYNHSKGLSV